ncbi:endo alpha-1,4 polygalactosaminidase [Microbacterium sp. LMI1x-1-1.1]|uniref:endo alpha-1,4 polygalactosaminidase n=1 Tax=Microbacterium sp. LMI1x-1-1.1 TaxID=3135246 RepID=UPI0039C8E5EB
MQIDSSGRARTSPPTPSSARRSTPWTPTDLTRSRFLHARAGFDFAVVEECAAYEECSAYTEVYGDHVLAIEYTDNLPARGTRSAPTRRHRHPSFCGIGISSRRMIRSTCSRPAADPHRAAKHDRTKRR